MFAPADGGHRVRLDRLLCERGLPSRKDAHWHIRRRHVTVNGEIVRSADFLVKEDDDIRLDDQPMRPMPYLMAYHKPLGVHATLRDPQGRPDLSTALPGEHRERYHPVGRLDHDTTGLLLFSRDGALTQRLLHPRRAVERTYRATVEGEPTDALIEVLANGVETAEGVFSGRVDHLSGNQVTLTVTEGKHRMVRRMLHNSGYSVLALHRIRYGGVCLGELAEGACQSVEGAAADWVKALLAQ